MSVCSLGQGRGRTRALRSAVTLDAHLRCLCSLENSWSLRLTTERVTTLLVKQTSRGMCKLWGEACMHTQASEGSGMRKVQRRQAGRRAGGYMQARLGSLGGLGMRSEVGLRMQGVGEGWRPPGMATPRARVTAHAVLHARSAWPSAPTAQPPRVEHPKAPARRLITRMHFPGLMMGCWVHSNTAPRLAHSSSRRSRSGVKQQQWPSLSGPQASMAAVSTGLRVCRQWGRGSGVGAER